MYKDRVNKIIGDHLNVEIDNITPETALINLGADSLDHIELTLIFEEEFDIAILHDELEHVITIHDIYNKLSNHLNEQGETEYI